MQKGRTFTGSPFLYVFGDCQDAIASKLAPTRDLWDG
ncbi:hypothetical protein PS659_03341 [Pseudomonas fluorescens]|uniref:Uncharacterized protein n=1 Tax=Pseudomonas fluorescens TaxID=294 RepID=A0A5E6U5G5_PSEFL|nr:hypothetical protein PS659_03341 [Pseudomonas fluorescens]